MINLIIATLTQALTLIPLALGINLSYTILRATDMTIDGSFVLGAAVFARLATLGIPPIIAFLIALLCGAMAGAIAAFLQRGGKVDPLLAGILTAFILYSVNLIIMDRPNINLLTTPTLFSSGFAHSQLYGWLTVTGVVLILLLGFYLILRSRLGLMLRAFGDNPTLLARQGKRVTYLRFFGFGLNNLLAAAAGAITAQTIGYADINMGIGMTLIGIGAIVLGQHIVLPLLKQAYLRTHSELLAAFIGITLYFAIVNGLLQMNVDPIYLKLCIGVFLAAFLCMPAQRGHTT